MCFEEEAGRDHKSRIQAATEGWKRQGNGGSSPRNRASLVPQAIKHLPTMWQTGPQSPCREGLLEKEMATHSSILARKSHGWRSLVGYSPWGRKESDTTKRLPFHFPQRTSPANTLLFSLTRLILDPDLQKHKIINVYCFKPRSWWSFLTAATGN